MSSEDVEVRRSRRRRRTVSAYRDGARTVVLIPASFTAAEEAQWVERMLARLRAGDRRREPDDEALAARARRLSRRYLGGHARPTSVRWVSTMGRRWALLHPLRRHDQGLRPPARRAGPRPGLRPAPRAGAPARRRPRPGLLATAGVVPEGRAARGASSTGSRTPSGSPPRADGTPRTVVEVRAEGPAGSDTSGASSSARPGGQRVDRPPPHVGGLGADLRRSPLGRHRDVPDVEVLVAAAEGAGEHVPVELHRPAQGLEVVDAGLLARLAPAAAQSELSPASGGRRTGATRRSPVQGEQHPLSPALVQHQAGRREVSRRPGLQPRRPGVRRGGRGTRDGALLHGVRRLPASEDRHGVGVEMGVAVPRCGLEVGRVTAHAGSSPRSRASSAASMSSVVGLSVRSTYPSGSSRSAVAGARSGWRHAASLVLGPPGVLERGEQVRGVAQPAGPQLEAHEGLEGLLGGPAGGPTASHGLAERVGLGEVGAGRPVGHDVDPALDEGEPASRDEPARPAARGSAAGRTSGPGAPPGPPRGRRGRWSGPPPRCRSCRS